MSDGILNPNQRTALRTLLTELRSSANYGYRIRQGKNWFAQCSSSEDAVALTGQIRKTMGVAEMIKNDRLPNNLMENDLLQDFIMFVDAEATKNWTQPYSTEIADLIIEGFVEAANSTVGQPALDKSR